VDSTEFILPEYKATQEYWLQSLSVLEASNEMKIKGDSYQCFLHFTRETQHF